MNMQHRLVVYKAGDVLGRCRRELLWGVRCEVVWSLISAFSVSSPANAETA